MVVGQGGYLFIYYFINFSMSKKVLGDGGDFCNMAPTLWPQQPCRRGHVKAVRTNCESCVAVLRQFCVRFDAGI